MIHTRFGVILATSRLAVRFGLRTAAGRWQSPGPGPLGGRARALCGMSLSRG